MTQNMKRCGVLILLNILWPATAMAVLNRPNPSEYPNPYVIMNENSLITQELPWLVVSNRENAPIWDVLESQKQQIASANYLEKFEVINRNGGGLNVNSLDRKGVTGWMDMRHLILIPNSIIDPKTQVRHKVFLSVRMDEGQETEQGVGCLRTRKGPGIGIEKEESSASGRYHFLISANETAQVQTLFYYVYAVSFDDDQQDYQDAATFKDADYFFIGESPSVSDVTEHKDTFKGWIPRCAAVDWDTRQAVEKLPHRDPEDWDAHKFEYRDTLDAYMRLSEQEQQQFWDQQGRLVNDNQDDATGRIVRDQGEGPSRRGQDLRDLILKIGYEVERNGVISERIGYAGDANPTNLSNNLAIQQELAKFQAEAKSIEIFFLVDATQSMTPVLRAASQVAGKIMGQLQQLRDEGFDITFHGALYRDASDEMRYDEFKGDENQLAAFFCPSDDQNCGGKAFSNPNDPYPYYPEDLFNAMKNAANTRWTNPYSTKILVILGDAGNHDSATSPSIQQIITQLRDKYIFPYAIQFQHDYTGSTDQQHRLEQEAMRKFVTDLRTITEQVYGDELLGIQGVQSVSDPESALEEYVAPLLESFRKLVDDLSAIRHGHKALLNTLCDIVYEEDAQMQRCQNAAIRNPEEFTAYVQNNPSANDDGQHLQRVAPILHKLNQIRRSNPDLADLLFKRPELTFWEGYMVTKNQRRELTRPVLLLGLFELNHIQTAIQTITGNYKFCDQAQNHQLLVQAMSTILGELLQLDPDMVTNDQIEKWLDTALVGQNGTFLATPEIVETMCNNKQLWDKFINALMKTTHAIDQLTTTRPEEKVYRDTNLNPYFWVYPEEIFPPAK